LWTIHTRYKKSQLDCGNCPLDGDECFSYGSTRTLSKTFLNSDFAQILKMGSKYFLLVRIESVKSHIQPNSSKSENKSLKIRKILRNLKFLTT